MKKSNLPKHLISFSIILYIFACDYDVYAQKQYGLAFQYDQNGSLNEGYTENEESKSIGVFLLGTNPINENSKVTFKLSAGKIYYTDLGPNYSNSRTNRESSSTFVKPSLLTDNKLFGLEIGAFVSFNGKDQKKVTGSMRVGNKENFYVSANYYSQDFFYSPLISFGAGINKTNPLFKIWIGFATSGYDQNEVADLKGVVLNFERQFFNRLVFYFSGYRLDKDNFGVSSGVGFSI